MRRAQTPALRAILTLMIFLSPLLSSINLYSYTQYNRTNPLSAGQTAVGNPKSPSAAAAQSQPDFSIAFVRDSEIWLLNNGSELQQVSSGGMNTNPAWSADGRTLSYDHLDGSGASLVIHDVSSGGSLMTIPFGCCSVWSASDPTRLAYLSETMTLVELDLSSGAQTVWTTDAFYNSPGQPYGRLEWMGDTIFVPIIEARTGTSWIWQVNRDGSSGTLQLSDFPYPDTAESRCLTTVQFYDFYRMVANADTSCMAFAPGGPVIVFNSGSGWSDLGLGNFPSFSPDGAWIVYESYGSCTDGTYGLCANGIGARNLDSGEEVHLLDDGAQPAWRPSGSRAPAPAATEPPIVATEPPVIITEPPAPPQPQSYFCGRSTTVDIYSGMTAYPQAVIIPCGASQPVAYGALGGWGDEKTYRFGDPQFEGIQPMDTKLGQMQQKMGSWSTLEEISSCQVCSLGEPQIQVRNSLQLKNIMLSQKIVSYEPLNLVLQLNGEGNDIANAPFIVDITFGKDFPYKSVHYVFDSQDAASRSHLAPATLQQGDFDLVVRDLRFPATYQGSITVSAYLKESGEQGSSISRNIYVEPAGDNLKTCNSALLKAANLFVEGPLPQQAQVAVTVDYLETQAEIVECTDNLACQTGHTRDFIENLYTDALEAGIEMIAPYSPAGIALMLKHAVEFWIESAKCTQSLVEYVRQMIEYTNLQSQGAPISAYLTASPVYPLLQDAQGRRSGFLPDGSLVQEIPEAQALSIGEERLILFPGGLQNTLQINGYAQGTMDLYAFQAQGGGQTVELNYSDVPVSPGAQMLLDPAESQTPLHINANGVSETRLPDQLQGTVVQQPPTEVPPSAAPQPLPTAAIYVPSAKETGWMGFASVLCIAGPLLLLLSIGLGVWLVRKKKMPVWLVVLLVLLEIAVIAALVFFAAWQGNVNVSPLGFSPRIP